jgi:hypothetical protein
MSGTLLKIQENQRTLGSLTFSGTSRVSLGHTCNVAPTGFSDRLAFARLVFHYRTGRAPSNAEIADAAKRTGEWLTKWAKSATPPRDFTVHGPVAGFLQVDERWLFRGEGEPPMPRLWEEWLAGRTRRVAEPDPTTGEKRDVSGYATKESFKPLLTKTGKKRKRN